MSIAVCAVVRPPVRLRLALAGFAGAAGAAACALARAEPGAFRLALPGAALSLLAGLLSGLSLFKHRTRRRIDISPVGQIRVTVYQHVGPGRGLALMPGSTLWPGLLLLRLRAADGRVEALQVWPGDVAGGAFRPLAVACRALAARRPGVIKNIDNR